MESPRLLAQEDQVWLFLNIQILLPSPILVVASPIRPQLLVALA
jgi:hypothetical protein